MKMSIRKAEFMLRLTCDKTGLNSWLVSYDTPKGKYYVKRFNEDEKGLIEKVFYNENPQWYYMKEVARKCREEGYRYL